VTVGVLLSRKLQPRNAPGYLVTQAVGAVLAASVLWLIANGGPAPYDPAAGFAANGDGEHSPGRYTLTAAFLVEVVLTAVFVLTVLGATAVEAPVGFAGIPSGGAAHRRGASGRRVSGAGPADAPAARPPGRARL
jgi:aquaporin Z